MSIAWAIVGIGRHADNRIAPAIARAGNGRLVAVLSQDATRARAFAEKHGAERAYVSLESLLEDPAVDAVFIASPNSLHAAQTIQAAQAGKHVLCEKPMALTLEDCRAMIEACDKAGVKLGLGFHLRHYSAHLEAQRLIASGELGEVVFARVQESMRTPGRTFPAGWRNDPEMAGGGVIMSTGVHGLDLLRFLIGSEVAEVTALTETEPPQLEALAIALMRFENGAHATLECFRGTPHLTNDLALYASKGLIRVHGTIGGDGVGQLELQLQGSQIQREFPAMDPYLAEVEDFGRCILEGGEPLASGLDGLRTAELTQAIFHSSRLGKRVSLR